MSFKNLKRGKNGRNTKNYLNITNEEDKSFAEYVQDQELEESKQQFTDTYGYAINTASTSDNKSLFGAVTQKFSLKELEKEDALN